MLKKLVEKIKINAFETYSIIAVSLIIFVVFITIGILATIHWIRYIFK